MPGIRENCGAVAYYRVDQLRQRWRHVSRPQTPSLQLLTMFSSAKRNCGVTDTILYAGDGGILESAVTVTSSGR